MSDSPTTTTAATAARTTGYEQLSNDIRLLGRILGDTVRAQSGDDTFELIESVRKAAVGGRRNDESAVEALRSALSDQPIEQQLDVIRAFDWLSLLANTAEDVHLERRRRFHRAHRSMAQPGSLDATFERLRAIGVDPTEVVDVIGDLVVSPVITAHPTEVRRQTILDVLREIAEVLDERNQLDAGDPALDDAEAQLEVSILSLWQTALLRLSKLRVSDEINEALRYYPASLFETIPALSRHLEQIVEDGFGGVDADATAAVSMGSWIGGDRDGNPFVTADVMRLAIGRHTHEALGHHLATLHRLGRELSMSARLITPTP